jgi:hypothetical protein
MGNGHAIVGKKAGAVIENGDSVRPVSQADRIGLVERDTAITG